MDDQFFTTHPLHGQKRGVDEAELDYADHRPQKRRRLEAVGDQAELAPVDLPVATPVKGATHSLQAATIESPKATATTTKRRRNNITTAGHGKRAKGTKTRMLSTRASKKQIMDGQDMPESFPSITPLQRRIVYYKGKRSLKLSATQNVARASSETQKRAPPATNGKFNDAHTVVEPEGDRLSESDGDQDDPDATLVDPAYDETFLPTARAVIKRKRGQETLSADSSIRPKKRSKQSDVREIAIEKRVKMLRKWQGDNVHSIRENNELLAEMSMDLVGRLMAAEKKCEKWEERCEKLGKRYENLGRKYEDLGQRVHDLEIEQLFGNQSTRPTSSDRQSASSEYAPVPNNMTIFSMPPNVAKSIRAQQQSTVGPSSPSQPSTTLNNNVQGYELIRNNPSFMPGLTKPKSAPQLMVGDEVQKRARWDPTSLDPDPHKEAATNKSTDDQETKRAGETGSETKRKARAGNDAGSSSVRGIIKKGRTSPRQKIDTRSKGEKHAAQSQKGGQGSSKKA